MSHRSAWVIAYRHRTRPHYADSPWSPLCLNNDGNIALAIRNQTNVLTAALANGTLFTFADQDTSESAQRRDRTASIPLRTASPTLRDHEHSDQKERQTRGLRNLELERPADRSNENLVSRRPNRITIVSAARRIAANQLIQSRTGGPIDNSRLLRSRRAA